MRIARIAVLATEFTPTIRVDGPHEPHPRTRSSTDKPAGFQLQILHPLFGFERGTCRSQARNANELGWRVVKKHYKLSLSSPFIRHEVKYICLAYYRVSHNLRWQ